MLVVSADMASNVPKFASFRPKPKPETAPTQIEDRKVHDSSRTRQTKEQKDHVETRGRDETAKPRETAERDVQKPYYVDRRGDPAIVTYGGLNRYEIPLYRRSGYGSVLGMPSGWKIDRDQSTDKGLVFLRPGERRRERLLTGKHVFREHGRSYKFVKAIAKSHAVEELDYIELPGGRKRKLSTNHQDGETDYRSLEPATAKRERPDSDLDSETDSGTQEADGTITRRNTELVQRTRDQPHDLQAWLDLADHQQAMMTLGRGFVEPQRSDRRPLAEVRISTYEQAIRKMGSDEAGQAQLHLRLLTEASFAWEDDRLMSRWKEVLPRFSTRPELWMGYLDFVQSRFIDFKYESCRTAFHQCLTVFHASQSPFPAEVHLHVILRLTCMIREAGYQELAVAIWQGLIEFRLFRTEDSNDRDSSESLLERFEEFWDSEVPRIGEVNAKGWQSSDANDDDTVAPASLPPQQVDGNQSVFEQFKVRETDHMNTLRHPGRTQDDVAEDDPFHLVLFSDLAQYLDALPQDMSDELLIDAFLCFCRMPPLPRPAYEAAKWWRDPFLQDCQLHPSPSSNHSPIFNQTLRKYIDGPKRFSMSVDLLFDHGFSDPHHPGDLEFLRHALKLLAGNSTLGEAVGEYLIAFEVHHFPSEVTKSAKKLLKARPTSSRLYNAYALSESCRGNIEKADQVFRAALAMHNTSGSDVPTARFDLLKNWAWQALRRNDKVGALWRIVSVRGDFRDGTPSQPTKPDQTALLRARTFLSEANERALLRHDHCAAVTSRSAPAELHAQSMTQLLLYHATTAAIVKPSLIRSTLELLITRFPDNTILMSLYAANEARFAIDDRVRSIMQADAPGDGTNKSVTRWLFAIHHELQRGEIAGSTNHSVRALFRKAEDEVGAHCPALWKSHVLFELREARIERQKRPPKKRKDAKKSRHETRLEECHRRVKEAFFRGLTNLPWCKDYMMLAFTHLQDSVLNDEDLRKVYNVMVEKELRIYVDVDLGD
ncbi:DUF1740-domain-containing protein [Lophiostoma macrostomum CBS 122681]|uniref:DUF1740-domain-containing protein n=1 Tax=Lophiostoma macrostomum CBS 122681 TaxID=1314788 RepID=A0A6A6SW25_9PLEO|nr:DUF1740-domain-containing protein [Lophiostoma macrostomum CBS 122681]